MAAGIRHVLQHGTQPYSLTHLVNRNGSTEWYRVTATSLGDGELIGAVIMYRDVTQQHRRKIKYRTGHAAGSSRDAIFVQDMEGRIRTGTTATRLHGWSKR